MVSAISLNVESYTAPGDKTAELLSTKVHPHKKKWQSNTRMLECIGECRRIRNENAFSLLFMADAFCGELAHCHQIIRHRQKLSRFSQQKMAFHTSFTFNLCFALHIDVSWLHFAWLLTGICKCSHELSPEQNAAISGHKNFYLWQWCVISIAVGIRMDIKISSKLALCMQIYCPTLQSRKWHLQLSKQQLNQK